MILVRRMVKHGPIPKVLYKPDRRVGPFHPAFCVVATCRFAVTTFELSSWCLRTFFLVACVHMLEVVPLG